MEDVKTESNSLCHGCLSSDRRISPLGENTDTYLSLVGNQKQCLIYSTSGVKLCWECTAKLENFKTFQMQLRTAQNVLVQFLYRLVPLPEPLSKLQTTTKTFYDKDIKQEKKRGKSKTTKIEDLKKVFKEIDIKVETLPDDEHKTEVVNEDDMMVNDGQGDVIYASDVKNDLLDTDVQNDDYGDETGYVSDFKMESVEIERNESKMPKVIKHKRLNGSERSTGYFARLYTENATLIERKQIDWGDIQSYFTTVYFDETELEQYIFVRERIYMDYERYKFSCTKCKLGYKSSLDLKRHNNLNHRKPDSPYKCSACQETVGSQTELECHWRGHTPIAKCNLCGHVLRPRGMKQHLNGAHTKQYACKHCTVTFGTISSFGAHFRDNHMKYTCDHCKKNFKSKSRIAYHIRNIHEPAYCAECNRPYLNKSQYMKHCILMHPQLTKRHEIPSEDCFCVECNKQYRSLAQYRKHLKVSAKHVEVKRQTTPCPECGKIFARKMYMKNHYNLYHLKKTKYYCELCDKYFARGWGLRVHNTHVHQKVQRVRDKICDLCGRAFSNNRTMLNHRRTHTGERPHKCPYCTAEFIQKYAMQTHMRTQHKHFT